MSSLADSEAHFQSRADEYGVPADVLTNIKNAGIRTLGQLAFAFARPGQEYTDTQFLAWLKDANAGVDPTMGASASVRRLHFESEVIVTASLKAAVETPSSDSSVPKPIPIAEKNVRMQKLRNDLGGINVEGPHEPSHALIEECVQQYDNRILKYIEPSKCTSRESELLAQKVDKRLQLDHNSVLKVKDSKTIPDADAATAFALLQCFRRRGIAYEFAQLISFTAHDKYIDALLRHLSMEPPPNYAPTSLTQVLRADRQVFMYLCREVTDIRPDITGKKPLDDALMAALRDYHTAFHLMPLPSQPTYAPWRSADTDRDPKGKGKDKNGKGKKGKGSSVAPRGMVGCVGRDNKGRNICFNYNLSECKAAPDGGSCQKGRHVCFKANCFKPHAFCKAHSNEMPAASHE